MFYIHKCTVVFISLEMQSYLRKSAFIAHNFRKTSLGCFFRVENIGAQVFFLNFVLLVFGNKGQADSTTKQ